MESESSLHGVQDHVAAVGQVLRAEGQGDIAGKEELGGGGKFLLPRPHRQADGELRQEGDVVADAAPRGDFPAPDAPAGLAEFLRRISEGEGQAADAAAPELGEVGLPQGSSA